MSKKVNEMTAAGSGATVGPIQPIGVEKEKVDEMLQMNPDLKHGDVVVFLERAHHFDREDFGMAARFEDYHSMGELVRETVTRAAVQQRLTEVVRKKDGKYVLFAPNAGKKHNPKPIATFTTKLAAKRAELAKFPPKDPKKLERLRKQIEKLMKDPKERRKELTKEKVDRDLFERAVISAVVQKDLREHTLHEGLFRKRHSNQYENFVKSLSKKAVKGDKDYQALEKKLSDVSSAEMKGYVKELENELQMPIVAGEPKKHTDGKMYMPFSIKADVEIKPLYLYVEDDRIKVEFGDEAIAALTKVSPEAANTIRAKLSMLGEGPEDANPNVAQARGERDAHLEKIVSFLDNFLAKLTPLALTSLKKLLVKKYRKLGVSESVIRENSQYFEFQMLPDEQRLISRALERSPELANSVRLNKGMVFVSPQAVPQLLGALEAINQVLAPVGDDSAQALITTISRRSGVKSPQDVMSRKDKVSAQDKSMMRGSTLTQRPTGKLTAPGVEETGGEDPTKWGEE